MTIDIFDMNGNRIKNLAGGMTEAGNYRVTWDGTSETGNPVSSGVYYCRIQTVDINKTMKMILMR
jgi:flagellar hook assembly protein FlgD